MDEPVEQQAIIWHDRLRADASAATRAAFDAWQRADPRHAAAFVQQQRLTDLAQSAGWRGVMPAPARSRGRLPLGLGMAFGAAAAAAVALIVLVPWISGPTPQAAVAEATGTAPSLGRRLPDGSLLAATADAVVAALPGDRRAVRLLRGAARFFVRHDPAHPFRVTADGVIVTARGTVFDVALSRQGARVTLLDGRVDVAAMRIAGPAVALAPGETLGPGTSRPEAAVRPAPLAWLEVDGMRLGDVLTIAARDGGRRIVLADPALANRRVTGRFDLSQPDALANKLAAALDLVVRRRGAEIVLSPK